MLASLVSMPLRCILHLTLAANHAANVKLENAGLLLLLLSAEGGMLCNNIGLSS